MAFLDAASREPGRVGIRDNHSFPATIITQESMYDKSYALILFPKLHSYLTLVTQGIVHG